jgi:hypothetical protein
MGGYKLTLTAQNPLTERVEVAVWSFETTMVASWRELPIFFPSACDAERTELLVCRRAVELATEIGA